MSLEANSKFDASTGELITQLSSQLSRLVRDEMRLAQKEFQQSANDTVDALTAKLDRSKAAAKPSLVVVASVAGTTLVSIFWWRRRFRRRAS